ncbi:MAG: hypothetical protein ACOY16_14025 [Chloroflexota bacterium]
MARQKIDLVIEAIRYKPNGEINWVRAYERRGATYSDHILLSRDELIQKLKAGKRAFAGRRIPFKASTFELSHPIQLRQSNGKLIIVTEGVQSEKDKLDNVPLI